MSDPVLKLQILVRAELALAQIHARRAAARSAFFSVAMVFLLLGLAMMTLALYHALTPSMGPAWAAFVVALIDTFIAIIVILIAKRAGPAESEEALAREIRDMAYTELSADIEHVKSQLRQITDDVKRIRSGFASMTSGAVGALGPLVSMLIKAVKRD